MRSQQLPCPKDDQVEAFQENLHAQPFSSRLQPVVIILSLSPCSIPADRRLGGFGADNLIARLT